MADNNNKPEAQAKQQKAPKEAKAPKDAKPKKKGFNLNDYPLPEYVQHRLQVWEEIKKSQEAVNAEQKKPIKITLPDGSVKDGVAFETSPFDIARAISKSLAESCVAAKVNGEIRDLNRPFEEDSKLELLKFDSEEGKNVFWHSSAHILGQALERKYKANLCIGPPIDDGGFYYDMASEQPVAPEDYEDIQGIVSSIISEKQPFERLSIPKEKAMEMFKFNKYKLEIIKNKVPDGANCTAYRCGPLIDLCKGPHLPNTGVAKAFAVTKNSSAYWLGNAKNDALQRVYGISFPDKKQLAEWEEFQREAAKRDHRNIGKAQDLFFVHPYSPGSSFFLPHGTKVYNKLVQFLRGEYRKRGFSEVITPNMFNSELWQASGHWAKYKDNMFNLKVDDQDFALKPMNCPGHCLMFDHTSRSYRDLPIRFADFGVLHRNEAHGALTGLTRVRRFQQDDAHIFCTQDQISQEIQAALEFMSSVYGIFGFEFTLELSTRPENFLGELAVWDKAEASLKEALDKFGKGWKLNPGDGAFYGPKIDIHVTDALKREHQCATIQLDFNLPVRFGLNYRKNDDSMERPVIIHRAILGSVERFMAILIEHCAGKWPFWVSPRQAIVVNVSEKSSDYAAQLHSKLWSEGFEVEIDISDKTLQKKIREAQLAQFNFILVVGEEEAKNGTVNVRTRDNVVHGTKAIAEVIAEFHQLEAEHK
jgi:threonyl-tRNA synthetase